MRSAALKTLKGTSDVFISTPESDVYRLAKSDFSELPPCQPSAWWVSLSLSLFNAFIQNILIIHFLFNQSVLQFMQLN